MRIVSVLVVLVCSLCVPGPSALASDTQAPEPRTISVRGRAEIEYPADHMILSASVVAKAQTPDAAQNEARRKATAVLNFVKSLGVDDKDTLTDFATLDDTTDEYDDDDCPRQNPEIEFTATIGIRVILRDFSKYDELVAGLLKGGVNRIRGISFESTEQVAKAKEARIEAIRAAREKADYLASQLGQKVGHPLEINEVYERKALDYSVGYSNSYQIRQREASFSSNGSSLSPNRMTAYAEVDVVFELED